MGEKLGGSALRETGKGSNPSAVLWVVGIAIFVDMLIYGLIVPILPVYAEELGASESMIGALFASYAIALFAATPFWGMLSDRIGRKKPLLWGLLGLAAATLLFAFAESFAWLVAARVLQGISAAATWTAGLALIAEHYSPETRGRAMGLALSGQAAGTLLGPTVGGWLYELGGYTLPFLCAAGLALLDGILRVVLLRRTEERRLVEKEKGSVWALLRHPALLVTGGAIAIGAAVPTVLEPTLPLHLHESLGASPGTVGLLFAVPTLAYGLVAPIIGTLSARWGHSRTIAAGLLVTALALPLNAAVDGVWQQAAALALLGAGMGTVLTPTLPRLALLAERHGNASYGATFAVYNTAYSAGMMVGPLLGGVLMQGFGLLTAYSVFGAVSLLYITAFILNRKKA
ncbi:MFS transporter [Saccharibacillus alkalitolerans]|uniref:MFS transporter n=1 Tax=Saccharibacillus alkalitolerans TaxID=2705290 RepID=A0ABX0F943_9BACL|nr:MFS transporter [Saccharibacillus alkalitolerans]NGZ77482.1 MFS transporter [Saccharibacillus alkalitolerans]